MSRNGVVLAAAVLTLAVAGYVWREGTRDVRREQAAPAALSAPTAPAPAPSAAAEPDLPPSLRGSEPDGALSVDASGRFVPDRGALARFDWFLSATGEEPADALRARIVRHLRETLAPDAAAEAEAFLDRYLAYRDAMRELTRGGAVPDDLERRLQWIRETRRAYFGPELAETLFGEEERVAMLDLERRAVVQDASLTPEEREERLAAIEARLPESVRAARASATAPARVAREVEAVRARGGSDAEVFAVRERAFGADAAERLAALDQRRAKWRSRLEEWRVERSAIEADPSLSPKERAAAVRAARAARFGPDEEARVRALDEAGP